MPGPVRILHTADSHIGAGWPARPRHDRPRRGDDIVDSYHGVLTQALRRRVDLVIHAGDLFDRPEPPARSLVAAAEPLLACAVAGTPVVIVPGNHERCAIPASVLLSHPGVRILDEPDTLVFVVRGTRVAVSGFPCLRRESATRFADALDATRWHDHPADVRVLAVHQTFESATCGPGDHRFRSADDVVERDAVPEAFHYVAAGHVHRHQVLPPGRPNGPPIVYAGSPDRVSFAETDEPKGFVVVHAAADRVTHEFIEHDVRPMSVWPLDVTGLTQRQIRHAVRELLLSLPRRAVAQVRMTGATTRSALQHLRFTAMAWQLRPDVLFTATTRAVEWDGDARPAIRTGRNTSAFDVLDAPAVPLVVVSGRRVRELPTVCGAYTLYDDRGRVLYVGKARNLRTRVQAHLRGKGGTNYFRGWTRQISRIETRRTHSDLEALLVEAELVRRLRPPYNRQMRRWKRYCYLRERGVPHHPLEVTEQRPSGHRAFGPFRSRMSAEAVRDAVAAHFGLAHCPDDNKVPYNGTSPPAGWLCPRYDQRVCSGPCAGRLSPADYHARRAARDAFLRGEDDTALRAEEARLAALPDAAGDDPLRQAAVRHARLLRATFDYCAILREAEALMDGLLVLPGPGPARTVVLPTPAGLRFDITRNDPDDVARIRRRAGDAAARGDARDQRLLKATLDGLCIAVRTLRQNTDTYRAMRRVELAQASPADLRAYVFGGRTATRTVPG